MKPGDWGQEMRNDIYISHMEIDGVRNSICWGAKHGAELVAM